MLLSVTDIQNFQRNGYLILPRFVTNKRCEQLQLAAAKQLQAAAEPLEYEADTGYPGAPASLTAPGGRTVRRLRNAIARDPLFHAWACDPTLVGLLAQLFNESVVLNLAHHNCVMTKHPNFGSATGWHRDIRYWSFQSPHLITAWLALGNENLDNGGLQVIPGSHRLTLDSAQLDARDFLRPEHAANQMLFAQGRALELQRGDVLLFDSRLFHAAGRNQTAQLKMSLAFAYRGVSNPPLAGSRSAAAGEIAL